MAPPHDRPRTLPVGDRRPIRGRSDVRDGPLRSVTCATHEPAPVAPGPAPARAPAGQAARGRGLGLRAEVGRLPRDRVRRRRRRAPAVAQRPPADPLLPGARVPRHARGPRRRDRHPRPGRPPALQRARPAHPPGRVADPDARGADAGAVHRVRPARARRRRAPRAALRRAARRAGGVRGRARRPDVRAHPRRARPGRRRGLAARRGGGHRQGARRALQARRAHGHGEDQAGPDHRRGRPRLAARQGGADGRLAHPRPVRRGRQDPRRRAHERVPGEGEARARRQAGAVRDRRARLGGPVAVGERPRARVDRAAPRARRRGLLRPRERRAHPARDQGPALARGPRSASPACSPSSMGSVPRP